MAILLAMIPDGRKMLLKPLLIKAVIFLFYIERSYASSSAQENMEICDTEECHQIADAFLDSMNPSADPCVNFYQFVCGSWESKNAIPKYHSMWSRTMQFQLLTDVRLREELKSAITSQDILPVRQAKKWYQSCINYDAREAKGLEPINSILQSTNGWPMILSTNAWNESVMSWQEIDKYYGNFIAENAFYNIRFFSATREYEDVYFTQIVSLTFPMDDELPMRYNNHSNDEAILYRFVIKNIAQLFIEQSGAHVSDEELEKDIDDLVKFENRLYEAKKNSRNHNETKIYEDKLKDVNYVDGFTEWWNNRTRSIAITTRTKINWHDVVQEALNVENITVSRSTYITTRKIGYLFELVKILESSNERTIVNYIQWNFLTKTLSYTTDKMKDIFREIRKRKVGIQEVQPRWRECVREMKMDRAAAYIFVQRYYSNITHEAVHEMFRNTKKSLESQITNSNWLSSKSIEVMRKKLNSIGAWIGYPNWFKNETAFINYYRGLTVSDDYLENGLNFIRYKQKRRLGLTEGTVVERMWEENLLTIDVMYVLDYNILGVPPAVLQPPLFGPKVPDYVNYAIMGSNIGHEMGHGFDTSGIHYGTYTTNSLLSDDMMEIHDERAGCFVEMFDHYFTDNNITLDSTEHREKSTLGRITLDENIADWIGIHAAIDAYKEMRNTKVSNGELKLPGFLEFTDEQMFFISYAQEWCEKRTQPLIRDKYGEIDGHTAGNLRVIGTVSNTPAFAKAFKCSKGSPMNPENRCDFWMQPSIILKSKRDNH